jgi:hypothetical protein
MRWARRHDSPLVFVCLLVALLTQYPRLFSRPFINDDYLILDATRTAPFWRLWNAGPLLFGWFRPWSREFHYWALQHLFGAAPLPFHIASVVLWLVALWSYFALLRRIAGPRIAHVATAAVATLALWGSPLLWIAGVQDLWALCFGLAALHLVVRDRPGLAAPLLLMALLSKESAVTLWPVAVGYYVILARQPLGRALRRTWPLALTVVAWCGLHPTLRDRFFGHLRESPETTQRLSPVATAARTLLAQVNLDLWPHPGTYLATALSESLAAAVVLAIVVLVGVVGHARRRESQGRLIAFGGLWALAGWSVLFLPSIGWHAYYGVVGSLGAWLVIGTLLSSRPRTAVLTIVLLALLRGPHAYTRSWDWGSEWYIARAGNLLNAIRTDMLRQAPTLPAHTRVFFVGIPNNIGLLAGDGPSLRVWYGDSTLRGAYYSQYTSRPRGADGSDRFFSFDSTTGLTEVKLGTEDVRAAVQARPSWEDDHEVLAALLLRSGDLEAAAGEFAKLGALPWRLDCAVYSAACYELLPRPTAAESCYRALAIRMGYPVAAVRESTRIVVAQLRGIRPAP